MWINSILREVAGVTGLTFEYVYKSTIYGQDVHNYINAKDIDIVSCGNPTLEDVRKMKAFRGFHAIRDPRDMVVSGYFSHRNSHWFKPGTYPKEHQTQLRALGKNEGLHAEIEFSRRFLEPIADWDYSMPNVMELRFEELTSSPYDTFLDVFRFLGVLDEGAWTYRARFVDTSVYALNKAHRRYPRLMPTSLRKRHIRAEKLLGIVHKLRFSKMSKGRKRGEEDVSGHMRKGVPGDWRNHLTPDHVAHFKEAYPGLVSRLKYEPDESWGVAPRSNH